MEKENICVEEFLGVVKEQIRCRQAREPVARELEAHLLDQAADYEQEGLEKEDAVKKAVREMGDPVEIGAAMNRIHRPKMSWGMLALAGVISLFSIALYVALQDCSEEAGMGDYYLRRQVFYVITGYFLMLAVYRLDYSFLGRRSRYIALGFLLFMIGGTFLFGQQIYGVYRTIRLTNGIHISIPGTMPLYVPVYGALLYDHRGQGYSVLWKMFLWAAVPLLYIFHAPSLYTTLVLGVSFAILFSVAVARGWYRVNKKAVLAVLWSVILGVPILIVSAVLSDKGERLIKGYQRARLESFLTGTDAEPYQTVMARQILQESRLVGRNMENMLWTANKMPEWNSDYVLVSLVAAFGILAGVLAILLLGWMIGKIFRISFRQKNQLGMIVGCSCGIVFLTQTVHSILVNLGLIPLTAASLPFFCFGGGSTIVSFILLGLVLSIYRYKDILTEGDTGKDSKGFRISVKITTQDGREYSIPRKYTVPKECAIPMECAAPNEKESRAALRS